MTSSLALGNSSIASSATFHITQSEFDSLLSSHTPVPLTLFSTENSIAIGDLDLSRYDLILQSGEVVNFLGTASFTTLALSATGLHSQVLYIKLSSFMFIFSAS